MFPPFEFVDVRVMVYFPGVENVSSGNLEVLAVPFTKLALFGETDHDQAEG